MFFTMKWRWEHIQEMSLCLSLFDLRVIYFYVLFIFGCVIVSSLLLQRIKVFEIKMLRLWSVCDCQSCFDWNVDDSATWNIVQTATAIVLDCLLCHITVTKATVVAWLPAEVVVRPLQGSQRGSTCLRCNRKGDARN